MALVLEPCLLAGRAVCEGNMVVGDIIEEVDFFLLEKEASRNGMDWRISPTFIKESTILVERFEVVHVRLGSKPVQVANFKIGPLFDQVSTTLYSIDMKTYEVAVIVGVSSIVTQKTHRVTLGNVLRMSFHELLCGVPQGRDRLQVLV